MRANLKPWRDSASLILVAKQPFLSSEQPKDQNNYKILTLKRSSKSSFMPDTHVFPGGTLDKADTTDGWIKLYEKFGIDKKSFDNFAQLKYRPPIFDTEITNSIPKFLSLRICAIRETFEECGVLLCKNQRVETNKPNSKWASFIALGANYRTQLQLQVLSLFKYSEGQEIQEWQKKVHNDATQFLELCHKFEVYPDVWSLYDWSNWLTPSVMPRRFDTIFFLAAVQNKPPTFAENTEVQHLQWNTPTEYLQKNENDKILIPPPQFYELSRLMNFSNIEEVANFASSRSRNGCERFLPYRIATDQMETTVLPGDDLYPGEEEAEKPNTDVHEVIPECKIMHRMLHPKGYKNEIIVSNFVPKYKHILPVTNFTPFKTKL